MKPTRKRERDKERKTVRNEPMKMKVNMIDDSSLIHFFFFFLHLARLYFCYSFPFPKRHFDTPTFHFGGITMRIFEA